MAESGGNPLLDIFECVHIPSKEKPWVELLCKNNENLFMEKFVNALTNIPLLDIDKHRVIFRGQNNEDWTLLPKLTRLWAKAYLEAKDQKQVTGKALLQEYDAIQYFQQRSSSIDSFYRSIDRELNPEKYKEWLALMQHYSAPTRLLDWTTSFYVALYFAAEDDSTDGAVWVMQTAPVSEYMDQRHEELGFDEKDIKKVFSDSEKYVEFGLNIEPIVEIVSNSIKTDRIIQQAGVFTISYNLFCDHVKVGLPFLTRQNSSSTRDDFPLFKLVIPKELKMEIRKHLSKINVFAETLFPGIEGIGRTISEKIQLFQENYM